MVELSRAQFAAQIEMVNDRYLEARVGNEVVGGLDLESPGQDGSRMINEIRVDPGYRRRGIATELWRTAERSGLHPRHSNARSEAGDGWAYAVGGDVPENEFPWEGEDDDD